MGFVGHYEPDKRIVVQTFLNDRMVLIVSKLHQWAGRKSVVKHHELIDQPFLLSKTGSGTWRTVSALLAQSGVNLKNTMELGTTEAVKRAVAANLGISLVAKHVLASELTSSQIKEIPMAGVELKRDFYLVYHKDRYLSEAARAFLATMLPAFPASIDKRGG